jgi:hypothetical protein
VEKVGQVVPLESGQPTPEAHVGGVGDLSLQPGHPFEGLVDRQVRSLEQKLAGEHRSVQLTECQHSIGHVDYGYTRA